jgi:hypothetical protein
MTWQPIETAPKDGTVILAYAKHAQVMNGEFHCAEVSFDRIWLAVSPLHSWPAKCTHWMPLPAPPEATL